VIDLHCHILPGVDDGPPSLDETLALARAQAEAGISRVAATPHVSWNVPTSPARMAQGVEEVNAALRREDVPVEIVAGGELATTQIGELSDDELAAFRLGGGPWLLVECPLSPAMLGFERAVEFVQGKGHKVLLAHPERCPGFQRDPARLAALVEAGALTSITAGAFVGRFGRTVERFAHRMAQEGLVHSVASDAHDLVRRPPGLLPDLEQAGYGTHAKWWCEQVPAAILGGAEIPVGPPPPEPPRKRGLAGLLRRPRAA